MSAQAAGGAGSDGKFRTFVKIVVVGEANVGKTCMLHSFVDGRYTESFKPTIGADFHTKELELDGKLVTAQFWDTAGQERFHSLGAAFFRGADACILAFDKTRATTLAQLEFWRTEFLAQCAPPEPESFPFLVVANKSDLVKGAAVSKQQAAAWATKHGALHFEVSAKKDHNVVEAFTEAIRQAVRRREEMGDTDFDFVPSGIDLSEPPPEKKEEGCCS